MEAQQVQDLVYLCLQSYFSGWGEILDFVVSSALPHDIHCMCKSKMIRLSFQISHVFLFFLSKTINIVVDICNLFVHKHQSVDY